jgi:hypothetical protein
MELFGSDPHTGLMGQRWRDPAAREGKRIRSWTGPDFTAGFHTFGLSWGRASRLGSQVEPGWSAHWLMVTAITCRPAAIKTRPSAAEGAAKWAARPTGT